jgi:hypothetical protein
VKRRSFLKLAGAAAALMGLPPVGAEAAPTVPASPALVSGGVTKMAYRIPMSSELLEDCVPFGDLLVAQMRREAWLADQLRGLEGVALRKRQLELGLGLGRTTPAVRLP